jgi:outer membrane protein OmpU
MKKILLGTTALAALGMVLAAAPATAQAPATGFKSTNFDFTIGGYARQYVGVVGVKGNRAAPAIAAGANDQNYTGGIADQQAFDQQSDMRLVIGAAATLSNGMRVGQVLHWEPLNAAVSASNQIRNNWSFISGGFGELRLGSTANAPQAMAVSAPDAFGGPSGANGAKAFDMVTSPLKAPADDVFNTTIRFYDRSANKIAYFSPRFEGFQLGLNYTPDATQNINSIAQNNTGYRYGKSVAINYTNTLAGVGVQAYGGYTMWEKPSLTANAAGGNPSSQLAHASAKDPSAWGAGLALAYQGIGVGGSYAQYSDGRSMSRGTTAATPPVFNNQITLDGNAWEAGAAYTFGPAMVSLNYFIGLNDAKIVNQTTGVAQAMDRDEKREIVALSGQYTLAPGVVVMASAFAIRLEGNKLASAAATPEVNLTTKGQGLIGALILNF